MNGLFTLPDLLWTQLDHKRARLAVWTWGVARMITDHHFVLTVTWVLAQISYSYTKLRTWSGRGNAQNARQTLSSFHVSIRLFIINRMHWPFLSTEDRGQLLPSGMHWARARCKCRASYPAVVIVSCCITLSIVPQRDCNAGVQQCPRLHRPQCPSPEDATTLHRSLEERCNPACVRRASGVYV